MSQIYMVDLESLVSEKHMYRRLVRVLDFGIFNKIMKEIDNHNGYGAEKMFRCIVLQHLEDLSDRELERFIEENNAAKWFCGFSLLDKTPDHSSFGKFRGRLGIQRMEMLFQRMREELKKQGLMNEFFSVVDATHLISKANLWEERDKAIAKRHETLSNEVLPELAVDKDARIGSKGKNKFWFGYKITRCIDMESGLLNKTAIAAGNVHDIRMLEDVLPSQGVIYADKGYSSREKEISLKKQGCTLRAIKKNNAKDKNIELDKWITKIRAPFERMFSKMRKRARYRGLTKNYFAELMDSMSFNLKRLLVLEAQKMMLS